MGKILNKLLQKTTNNFTQIPLFHVSFDYQRYIKDGEQGSCDCRMHPDLKNDTELRRLIGEVIDHIRKNYDMEKFTKI